MYLSFFTVGQQPTQQKLKWQNNILQKATTISTKKAPVVCTPGSHRYPVASNGKLLDVAVIGESAQSTQVSTQKPQSDSDVEVLGVTKQTQHTWKVRGKDRGLLECPKCSRRHANDRRWSIVPSAFLLFTKPVCLSVDVFASTDLCSELFLFCPQEWGLFTNCQFLKSEACLQTVGSSKVRLSHRVILQSSAGLQVPQKWGLVFLF